MRKRRIRLTRTPCLFAGVVALAVFAFSVPQASAQEQVPPAPPQGAESAQPPSGPTPQAQAPTELPKPDPANFTATSPTKETVDAFLRQSLGFDENRIWQVEAIQKTPVEGFSRVIVYMADKSGKQKPQELDFYVLPDGKHLIVVPPNDDIQAFGEKPYAEVRAELQQNANGPYRGSASKDFLMVEFADFQCPHCKEAQANMEKLATDFPKARIVFQNYPLEKIHAQAKRAASYSVCVAKLGGSPAFFQFVDAVFQGQEGLNTPDGATLTLNSSVTKVGLDPAKVGACAATPETDQAVENSVKLAQKLDVNQTPVLMVNGREIPANIPYETLKKIIEFQARLDGVSGQ
jgi:protein-disulfide isomerase